MRSKRHLRRLGICQPGGDSMLHGQWKEQTFAAGAATKRHGMEGMRDEAAFAKLPASKDALLFIRAWRELFQSLRIVALESIPNPVIEIELERPIQILKKSRDIERTRIVSEREVFSRCDPARMKFTGKRVRHDASRRGNPFNPHLGIHSFRLRNIVDSSPAGIYFNEMGNDVC